MPTFTGHHRESRFVRLPPSAAAEAFADLDRQIACHPELEHAEKADASTLRVRLKEMSHGPVKFAGHYTLVYSRGGDAVRWQSRDGNIEVRGTARFLPAGAGSRVDFEEEVRMEMELNRILAGVIRPVAEAMMARGMKGFVERMCGALDSLPG